jgi:phage regulator Rha-like protein
MDQGWTTEAVHMEYATQTGKATKKIYPELWEEGEDGQPIINSRDVAEMLGTDHEAVVSQIQNFNRTKSN